MSDQLPAWENRGAAFDLRDGRHVPRGGVFRASRSDPDVIRRRGKLRPASLGTEVTVPGHSDEARFLGVDFGSEAAYELAKEGGLVADDFVGEGSGSGGAFLTDDVRRVLADGEG